MRAFQKLVRNGNATAVTIPRAVLFHLRWLPGDYVVLEVQEDKSIRIRHVSKDEAKNALIPSMLELTQEPAR